ncbi:flagellar hook-basal body protein [Lederbergia lenta]|uniref:Flagellar hook-basal body protein n=1 Tax=Lederbergia lenta TaxID=1467 RepID=A0A2X4WJG3_LEDLE|nr:flagellar hook-basal body protein [Lederbergia lenta]MEC2323209.1 flagellar hook-basal body protein [Lederbergia lenta]SQI63029.1 flagellar hook-basal body protein [Lederbergia lenta]
MTRSMTTAVNTISQLQKQFDIISHNISNVQTNGFKKRDVSFSDMVYQQLNNQPIEEKEVGRLTPQGLRQGVGAKISKSMMVLQQGAIQNTDRALDIAFTEENQFLKVQVQENGQTAIRFTRNGALYLTPSGNNEVMLVTAEGHPVLDDNNNSIVFSDQLKEFTIFQNGVFQAQSENGQQLTANLGVVAINKPQYMEQKGDNLLGLPENLQPGVNPALIYTELTGAERNQVAVQQKALEASNVDLSKEMTEMINVQRALQFQSRSISLSDQMMGLVNGIR